eukprot:gene40130-35470_t
MRQTFRALAAAMCGGAAAESARLTARRTMERSAEHRQLSGSRMEVRGQQACGVPGCAGTERWCFMWLPEMYPHVGSPMSIKTCPRPAKGQKKARCFGRIHTMTNQALTNALPFRKDAYNRAYRD